MGADALPRPDTARPAVLPASLADNGPGETDKQHRLRHPRHMRNCDHCYWLRRGTVLQRMAAFEDSEGKLVTPIMAAPRGLRCCASFMIGCSLCHERVQCHVGHVGRVGTAADARPRTFALFRAGGRSATVYGLAQHLRSNFHKESLKLYHARHADLEATPLVCASQFRAEASTQYSGPGVPGVPSFVRFTWAALMCQHNGSYLDFNRWTQIQTFEMPGDTLCRTDGSSRVASQLVSSWAEVMREADHDLLGRSVRMAFSEDDADGRRAFRYRVAYLRPVVGSEERVGPVSAGFGTTADESANATREVIRQLCSKRVGKQRPRKHVVCDEKLLAHVQEAVFAAATDGCEVVGAGPVGIAGGGRGAIIREPGRMERREPGTTLYSGLRRPGDRLAVSKLSVSRRTGENPLTTKNRIRAFVPQGCNRWHQAIEARGFL